MEAFEYVLGFTVLAGSNTKFDRIALNACWFAYNLIDPIYLQKHSEW